MYNECVGNRFIINMKMTLKTIFVLFFNVPLVVMLRFEQPVPQKLWSERCERNTHAVNDCNWCHCNVKNAYTCNARACSEVDMFGHFNDAIKEMDVGMGGHGVWRTEESSCEPGVHYRKNDLLCVCTEDGKWPNPVCRDVFQVLHPVEATEQKTPTRNTSCTETKLYLYDCNVCFCPATGHIDPDLCTKRKCDMETAPQTQPIEVAVEEVYGTCIPTKNYKLGCQTCKCLRNNRLLCDNCTQEDNLSSLIQPSTACFKKKPGVLFRKDCNFCHCDSKDVIYCTAKICLEKHTPISLPSIHYDFAKLSPDEYNCVPGSMYKKDCNLCHCFMLDGVKYFGCTQNACKQPILYRSCVEGTSYQVNCLVCHCVVDDDNTKREFCTIDESCKYDKNDVLRSLSSMHGYCEPLHFYQQDCNKCRCLADGKTVACTSKLCSKKKERSSNELLSDTVPKQTKPEPRAKIKLPLSLSADKDETITIEFIPFIQKDNHCSKGTTYMIKCNVCVCMNNGNAICTTNQC